MDDEVYETAKRAIEKWGEDAQKNMAIGEIGELLELFGKHAQGRTAPENWADEIADVYIILPALIMIYSDREDVEDRIEFKLNQLQKRLNKDSS